MDRLNFRSFFGLILRIGVLAIACPTMAAALDASKQDPSPFAPGDLKAPIFDTQTPVDNHDDAQARTAGAVVADVDGRAITLADVRDAIAELPPIVQNLPFEQLFPGVVAQLVRQQALVIRAQQQALDEDPEVRRKIKAVSDRMLGDELLRRETSKSITEADLTDLYNKEIAGKPGPEEVHVRVIMVPTREEAAEAIRGLRGGANFADLAGRLSQDPTAAAGGDAGFVRFDQLNPEIAGAVFAMEPPQFTAHPVHSAGSWFVLKAEERRHQATRPFSEVREELRQALIRAKAAEVIGTAVAAVSVREYNLNGKETDQSAVVGRERSPK